MFKKPAVLAVLALLGASGARAQSHLLYLEAQGIAAYSTARKKAVFYSLSQEDVMQKPSLGFDYVLKLSGRSGEFGTLAVQARLAYSSEGNGKAQFQLYNAFFKYKARFADIWAGHNRPALGLSSWLDSHALLLPALSMLGYGFDRDWGAGLSRNFRRGNAAVSLTAGSGMPLRLKGNYLFAARVSRGVLVRDNITAGLSLAYGKVLDIMGYHLMSAKPISFRCLAADLTYAWNNLESRAEILAGSKAGTNILALFWRFGVNLLDEGRLKLEAQPILLKTGREWKSLLSGAVSYHASADLALRSMIQYDQARKDTRLVFQIYYTKAI